MAQPAVAQTGVIPRDRDLLRIAEGLRCAGQLFRNSQLDFWAPDKDPDRVAALEHAVDDELKQLLPEGGEGWLSEESADDHARLDASRVWIVDPLDGTREFEAGIPEWSISIGLVENGLPVAGGVLNPATEELFLGANGAGVTLNARRTSPRAPGGLDQTVVLASRSEVGRGEWNYLHTAPFQVIPMGSVAYKLARVAAGLADATWTLAPKNEWDVAAGVALLRAAGGLVATPNGRFPLFNRPKTLLEGLSAFTRGCWALFEDGRAELAFDSLGRIPTVAPLLANGETLNRFVAEAKSPVGHTHEIPNRRR